MLKQLLEEKIDFVKRMGLKAEVLERGHVELLAPAAGNQNHIGSMYAGALFTLAEIPGGALFLTSFNTQRFYPVLKGMNVDFKRPALGDIRVTASLSDAEIQRIEQQAETEGKAPYTLTLELKDAQGAVVAISQGQYQLRQIGR
ncbi:YiiD C-terminal domain-containing protein [Atopomonas hussainii]|uniref:YiiD C-terminal domain-containing protein n=1 Tax=Atopomonas hussainii TaxID=1429083 RepID=UPI0009003818|nr:YiiD C-terminal domain-containing protein [Atopomonas hussainii]